MPDSQVCSCMVVVQLAAVWYHCAMLLPPQARSQAEDFVFEWDEDEEDEEDNQTLNLFEERMAAQAAAEAASGQGLLDQGAGLSLCSAVPCLTLT
jgi:hypothetical protein